MSIDNDKMTVYGENDKAEAIYKYFKMVNEGEISKKEASEILEKAIPDMSNSSIMMHLEILSRMVNGKIYKRTMNSSVAGYCIEKIADDYDIAVLNNALKSVQSSIIYYFGKSNSKSNSLRKMCENTAKKYNIDIDFSDKIFDGIKEETLWEPSLEEYNPHITVEQWQELWHNPEVFDESSKKLMEQMMVLYGQATCAQLAEKFLGGSSRFRTYNSAFMYLGRKVHKKLNCPLLVRENEDGKHFWSVACFYRKVDKKIDDDVKGQYIFKLRDELVEALQQEGLQFGGANVDIPVSGGSVMPKHPKNLILYGPPGTGKTYNTVNYAVAIVEEKTVQEIRAEKREDVLARYRDYKKNGLIEFCTFHQSYSYEEFIEGIKPDFVDNNNLNYKLEAGAFKAFCNEAEVAAVGKDDASEIGERPTIWKVSLQGTGDNPVRKDCMEKEYIRIGYGDDLSEKEIMTTTSGILGRFINDMQIGDIVLSCYTENEFDAVGVVTGECKVLANEKDYRQSRAVKWLAKNIREDIRAINDGKKMTLAAVYRFPSISLADVLTVVKKYTKTESDTRNRVFIIDEINRGNISKIFGELITLIEDTKRIGADEEMRARLPYSGEKFGVPNNVYLLGTMNTADRSIALIDTALRRRFKFVEMQPDVELLKGIEVEGVKIKELLEMIDKRIEVLYDREHTIGHSFFMGLNNASTIADLAEIFECNVIPLLKEYFYNDFERIAAVLGDDLNKNDATVNFILRENDYVKIPNSEIEVPPSYKFNFSALENPEAYKKIYE